MAPPFFLHSPRLAYLRTIVETSGIRLDYGFEDLRKFCLAVDARWGTHRPAYERNREWLSPSAFFGCAFSHTPRHAIAEAYATYQYMAAGCPDPEAFAPGTLGERPAAAYRVVPSNRYKLFSDGPHSHLVTDAFLCFISEIPSGYVRDFYGLPPRREGILAAQCYLHAADASHSTAAPAVLFNPATGRTLSTRASVYSPQEIEEFFTEAPNELRRMHSQERLVDITRLAKDAGEYNADTAARFMADAIGKG